MYAHLCSYYAVSLTLTHVSICRLVITLYAVHVCSLLAWMRKDAVESLA